MNGRIEGLLKRTTKISGELNWKFMEKQLLDGLIGTTRSTEVISSNGISIEVMNNNISLSQIMVGILESTWWWLILQYNYNEN